MNNDQATLFEKEPKPEAMRRRDDIVTRGVNRVADVFYREQQRLASEVPTVTPEQPAQLGATAMAISSEEMMNNGEQIYREAA